MSGRSKTSASASHSLKQLLVIARYLDLHSLVDLIAVSDTQCLNNEILYFPYAVHFTEEYINIYHMVDRKINKNLSCRKRVNIEIVYLLYF